MTEPVNSHCLLGPNQSAGGCEHVLPNWLREPAVCSIIQRTVRVPSARSRECQTCESGEHGALPNSQQQPYSHHYSSGKETPHGQVGSERLALPRILPFALISDPPAG